MNMSRLMVFCLCTSTNSGQGSAAPQATFEVASVKPSEPGVLGLFTRFLPDGGVHFTGATVKDLAGIAYGVRTFQISGGPAWVDTERFDVDARVASTPGGARSDEQRKTGERLRNLLADRFQLAIHRETKDQPVLLLVTANGGVRLPPRLRQTVKTQSAVR